MKQLIRQAIALAAVVVAIFSVAAVPASAEKPAAEKDTLNARYVFVELPLENLDLLSRSKRLDMLDYYDLDSIYQAPNGMEGLSRLEKVTPDYLKVSITPVTDLEIKVLETKKEPIALVVYTIGGDEQAPDSDLIFLSEDLKRLDRDRFIKYPRLEDFFDCPDKEAKEKVAELVPFPTVKFDVVPGSSDLTATLTVGQFMPREDYGSIKQWLRPSLTYIWNGKKYELKH